MTIPFWLLVGHFVGDFVMQNDWMALNKSKRWLPLLCHGYIYAMIVTMAALMLTQHRVPMLDGYTGLWFLAITFATHVATDYITSRWTSALWFIRLTPYHAEEEGNEWDAPWPWLAQIDMKKRHWFFVAIGFDQLVHFATLGATWQFLVNMS